MKTQDIYPPVSHVLPDGTTTIGMGEFLKLYTVWTFVGGFSILLIIYDWAQSLPTERRLIWKGSKSPFVWAFLFSRYLSLLWSLTMLVLGLAVRINWTRVSCLYTAIAPQFFALILLSAHIVLILRVWALWDCRRRILLGLLGVALTCFSVEIGANLFVRAVLVDQQQLRGNQDMPASVCFPTPTSRIIIAAFVAPAVNSQVILAATLVKSIGHIRETGSALMMTLQRDQYFFVLAGCLADLVNVVLVALPPHFNYRMLGLLPMMVVTQILLGRMVFNCKRLGEAMASPSSTYAVHLPLDDSAGQNSSNALRFDKSPTNSLRSPAWLIIPDPGRSSTTPPPTSTMIEHLLKEHSHRHSSTNYNPAPSTFLPENSHIIRLGTPSGSLISRRRSASADSSKTPKAESQSSTNPRCHTFTSSSQNESLQADTDSPMWKCRGQHFDLSTSSDMGIESSFSGFGASPRKAV